eukprot:UN2262
MTCTPSPIWTAATWAMATHCAATPSLRTPSWQKGRGTSSAGSLGLPVRWSCRRSGTALCWPRQLLAHHYQGRAFQAVVAQDGIRPRRWLVQQGPPEFFLAHSGSSCRLYVPRIASASGLFACEGHSFDGPLPDARPAVPGGGPQEPDFPPRRAPLR